MIIESIEVFAGALVWVLPFSGAKQLGGIIIGDGLRRAFNGLEEIDKEKQERSSR
ncbi:MAG: hypothetical protein HY860_05715 [Chlamydiales bacterium]|nr:hypothetical protein [Chlamydiales bacterium]